MIKNELIKRSPLRIMEQSTQGGLGKGNLGVIAARKGVGKTAVLVHIETDQLFQDKHVIHVSFSSDTNHIKAWYEDIFEEIARRSELASAKDIHDEIIRNRVIMNFHQEGISVKQVLGGINSMIRDGHFDANMVVVDGFDFTKGSAQDINEFKKFAVERNIEIWFSASLRPEEMKVDSTGIPDQLKPYLELMSVVILLRPREGFIHLQLVKDHNNQQAESMHLKLDPKILLIFQEA